MEFTLSDIFLFGGIMMTVMLVMIVQASAYRRRLTKQLSKLKERKGGPTKSSKTDELSLRRKQGKKESRLIATLMKPLPNITKLGNLLEASGSKTSPQFFMLRSIFFALTIGIALIALGKSILLALFLGLIFGIWLPVKILRMKVAKKMKNFLKLFPDAIDLIVRGLRSGLPVAESIKLVSQEVPDPVGGTFKHVVDIMKLGVSLEKALQEMAKKLDSTEFNFFTTSIILQRETGGNLGEILSNLGTVLRERFMMRMKIKAMTSEARASAMIVGALPFLVSLAVTVMKPSYLEPLFTDPSGQRMLYIAIGMMSGGIWIMNRMTKFEI